MVLSPPPSSYVAVAVFSISVPALTPSACAAVAFSADNAIAALNSLVVVNAGLSGETTASGFSRVSWVLKTIPEVFVLELGANDGLRGIKVAETRKNLKLIINKVKEANPSVKILLAGMEVPPSMGEDYAGEFRKIFPEIAEEENISLIPFILDKVAGEPDLNIEDGIHPTEEGHQIVTETVWTYLEPLLNSPVPVL